MNALSPVQRLARALTWVTLLLAMAFVAAAYVLQSRMEESQHSVRADVTVLRLIGEVDDGLDELVRGGVAIERATARARLDAVIKAFAAARPLLEQRATSGATLPSEVANIGRGLAEIEAAFAVSFAPERSFAQELLAERQFKSFCDVPSGAVRSALGDVRDHLALHAEEMERSSRLARRLLGFACLMAALLALLVFFRQRDAARIAAERDERLASDERLNLLLAHTPVLLWSTDRDLRYTFLCGSALPPATRPAQQWIGQGVADPFGSDAPTFPPLVHHQAALRGESVRYAFEWRGRSFLAHVAPKRAADGSILGVVGAALDDSDLHHAEQQLTLAQQRVRHLEKMEAIGRLASHVAHDFNNFLTVVLGYAGSVLAELPPRSPLRFEVEEIARTAERASWLTRQLLTFSRPSRLAPEALDLGQAIRELAPLLERQLGSAITLSLDLVDDLPPILAHPTQVEQVILNLALNARDALPTGGRLELKLRRDLREPGVVLEVTDDGIGMAPEVRARLFEPFFSTKEEGKGSGLGLAIVDAIVRERGGSITVESTPGAGSCFRLRFPAAPEDAPRRAAPPRSLPAPLGAGQAILVVEDDDAVRTLAVRVLEAQGYHVTSSRSGADALELHQQRTTPLDLLLTDERMPRMPGSELLAQLRQRQPGLRAILMSTYSGGTAESAAAAGVDFLAKPFTVAELLWRVHAALDG
ncbi:MAG: response regulator [Planctomycetes bacterium]|nr:response regulator [Planctomycetota bacterium]